jgi:hypothetical protein
MATTGILYQHQELRLAQIALRPPPVETDFDNRTLIQSLRNLPHVEMTSARARSFQKNLPNAPSRGIPILLSTPARQILSTEERISVPMIVQILNSVRSK